MNFEEKTFIVASNGFSPEDAGAWFRKYQTHRGRAVQRGYETELTFDQYLFKVSQAGLTCPDAIGTEDGQFQLARHGDSGDYTVNNCRFITVEQNRQEARENGRFGVGAELQRGQTKETSEIYRRVSETLRGRTKETHPGVAAQAVAMTGRTKESHAGLAVMAEKNTKRRFVITAPDGSIHHGRNVVEFCKLHGLTTPNVYALFAGRIPHHKGWIGHYVE